MKQILSTLALGLLSIAAFSNPVNTPSPFDSVNRIELKTVNTRAAKDFKSRFANVKDGSWYADNNGSVSYFSRDGYMNRVHYDKKGRWEYSLLCYGEDKLDREIRQAVRISYYDLNITLVKEVRTNCGTVFFITLEDKSSIKILKINYEGEMELTQELVKQ